MPSRNPRGQIILPVLLTLPIGILFAYLLFETGKMSREKIRHQFALDAASFVEMVNYTDFLNQTAYVNGAFPFRDFVELFSCPPAFCQKCPAVPENSMDNVLDRKDSTNPVCIYDMLYDNGAFPASDKIGAQLENQPVWDIRFDPMGARSWLNSPVPFEGLGSLDLITETQAETVWIPWEMSEAIYTQYRLMYTMLGEAEAAHIKVYQRLSQDHLFFRKSYYLNSGDCPNNPMDCNLGGIEKFTPIEPRLHYLNSLVFWANAPATNPSELFDVQRTDPQIDFPAPGLFQFTTVDENQLTSLKDGYGITLFWDAPSNYFQIKVADYLEDGTILHSRIGTYGGKVWPDPTPKYQTRLQP